MQIFKIVVSLLAIGGSGYALFRFSHDAPAWVKVLSLVAGIATLVGTVIVLPQALDALEQTIDRVGGYFTPSDEQLRNRAETTARQKAEQEARQNAAEDAVRRQREEELRKTQAERQRAEEQAARVQREIEATRRAEQERQRAIEQEAQRQRDMAAEQQRQRAEQERQRREADRQRVAQRCRPTQSGGRSRNGVFIPICPRLAVVSALQTSNVFLPRNWVA